MNLARPIPFESPMEQVAARLLGEPNQKLSKPPRDVRFGTHGSMSIDYAGGRFFDHEKGTGGGVIDLIMHKLNCDRTEAVGWLRQQRISSGSQASNVRVIEATYDYQDESGALLFQVVRYPAGSEPRFRQRRPGARPGEWTWKLENARRVLYRLPDVSRAVAGGDVLYAVEGERDCESLRALGFAATTNPGGAGKWRAEYSECLRNADVVIVGDNDDPGRSHVSQVAESLRGVAKRVRVLDLARVWPECPEKGDISDWIAAGGIADQLQAFIEALPDWRQAKAEAPRALMREMPPPDPFPINALGSMLATAARAIHDRTQAPMAICAQSVIATATLVVQGHADVELPIGGKRAKPISSYFVTIAETGERKTEADYQAGWAIRQHEKNLRDKHDARALAHANDKEAWDKARSEAVKKAKGNRAAVKLALDQLGPPPAAPLAPMLTSTEPTFEGLVKQLPSHLPSLGIYSSEGGQFIGGHGMNDENRLKTAAGLSAFWDGETVRRVRAGDGASVFPGRRLAAHLMVQPEIANILLQDRLLLGQGLLSRLLVTAPKSASGTRQPRPEKPETAEVLRAYGGCLLDILEKPLPLAPGKTNELAPRALPLSADAANRWQEFVGHVESQIGPSGSLEPIKGLANKLPEHAARLAAVRTLVGNINAIEISDDDMKGGIALAEHYAAEALRTFEASKVSADLWLAQRLLEWLQHQWTASAISLPDIYQRSLNAIRDQATARKLVAILVDHGWLVPVPGGAVVAGQSRREAWRIVKGG